MGFIRGFLVVILSVLLLVSLLFMNLSLMFNLSLQYDNVEEEVGEAIESYVDGVGSLDQILGDKIPEMQAYCAQNPGQEFVFSEGDSTISVSCQAVSEGSEAVFEDAVENLIEEAYYEDYDCSFFNCLKEGNPLSLVSERTKDYWKGKFIFALIVSLALVVSIIFLVEKKSNGFILTGGLLILSSLPFKIPTSFLPNVDSLVLAFVNIFFSKSPEVFAISFISGLVLLVVGILMKLFMTGFKISKWFEKFKNKKNSSEEDVSQTGNKKK